MKKHLLLNFGILLTMCAVAFSCSDDDKDIPNPCDTCEYGWGKTMQGNDPDEYTWPDLYENYWEYTLSVTEHPNVGLRFKGQYPNEDTRFFNITYYNDTTMVRLGSIEDFNIEPNSGSKNPFNTNNVTGKNYYEVNLVPEGTSSSVTSQLKNVRKFPADTKRLMMLLRIYFNSKNHDGGFGGVDKPEITMFDINTGKELGKAPRAKSQYYQMFALISKSIPTLKAQQAMVFTLAPNIAYSNGPTGYVSAANRITTGQGFFFRFIPPVSPSATDITTNRTADVRYWSICVGDTATYTPHTLADREVVKDGDYVNFMIVTNDDPMLQAVKAKAAQLNINLIVWDINKHGAPMMVFYRQMYIRDGFEYSVQKITPYPPLKNGLPDPSVAPTNENLAHMVLGEHGPFGIVYPSSIILAPGFTTANIRVPYGQ